MSLKRRSPEEVGLVGLASFYAYGGHKSTGSGVAVVQL